MSDSTPVGPQLFPFVRSIAPAAAAPAYSPGFEYINATGAFLRVTEANIPFSISIDDQTEVPWGIAHEYACPPGEWFRRIKVINTHATETLQLTMLIGRGSIKDDRLAIVRERPAAIMPVIEAKSEADGIDIATLAATTGQTLAPVLSGLRIQRKAVTVSNRDATTELQLRDTAGHVVGIIFAQTTQIYHVSETVEIYNPNPAPVACHVGEIYWLRQP